MRFSTATVSILFSLQASTIVKGDDVPTTGASLNLRGGDGRKLTNNNSNAVCPCYTWADNFAKKPTERCEFFESGTIRIILEGDDRDWFTLVRDPEGNDPDVYKCESDVASERSSHLINEDEASACRDVLEAVTCPPKKVFVSSKTYTGGQVGNTADADTHCQSLANAAGVYGIFKAWLSDNGSSPAESRFDKRASEVGYQLLDGTPVADGWDDLTDGTLTNPIDLDENETNVNTGQTVWTGTYSDGTAANENCDGWQSSQAGISGKVGYITDSSGIWWSEMGNADCSLKFRIYCFEQ